jgi:hypothetical protein
MNHWLKTFISGGQKNVFYGYNLFSIHGKKWNCIPFTAKKDATIAQWSAWLPTEGAKFWETLV